MSDFKFAATRSEGVLPYEGYQEHMVEDSAGVLIMDIDGYQFAECELGPPAIAT